MYDTLRIIFSVFGIIVGCWMLIAGVVSASRTGYRPLQLLGVSGAMFATRAIIRLLYSDTMVGTRVSEILFACYILTFLLFIVRYAPGLLRRGISVGDIVLMRRKRDIM